MILVMIAITMSLALTYGFMRTQATTLQLTQNELRRDLALEAARTGISAALLRMQSPDWVGVSDTLSRVTFEDGANRASCSVAYSAVRSGELPAVPDAELPLHLCITSTGRWTSPRDSTVAVERVVRAFVRLVPRLPGRTIRAGDVASATDLRVNPAGYAATLPYTLTTTASSSTTLSLDAGARIEGPVWLNRGITLYDGEKWSSSIRATMLTEIGNQFGLTSPFSHPHPLEGPIRFRNTPSSSLQNDLNRLKTPWTTASQSPSVSTVNASAWQSYRLYAGGPVYQAGSLSNSLSNVTLRPTPENPLGIFVRSGNLDVYDRVIIQGTLVVTGTVSFWGTESIVSAYNWVGTDGPVIAGAEQWPRLPALLARQVSLSNESRQIIEGAVLVDNQLTGGGGNFGFNSSNWVHLTGTATAVRGEQPYSTVQLAGSPDLSAISGSAEFAVWLSSGQRGRWYPIHAVDRSLRRLTVVGEVTAATPTPFQIRPNRSNFVMIRGPVVASTVTLRDQSMWDIASSIWNNTTSDWNQTNAIRNSIGEPRISFPDWVANPANLIGQGWFLPWQTMLYGLQLEPTISLEPNPAIATLNSVPLFSPYSSTGTDQAASGYRWKVVEWREDL